jgi:8-oxo-dGTP pyrophosphatase MutT (NUDIX family)
VASDAVAAATVVPLRDGAGGLETLMLRRNSRLEFAGGMWVWPGGRVDPADGDDTRARETTPVDPMTPAEAGMGRGDLAVLEAAARRAAVREAREEADLTLDPASLVWFSHWTPPESAPKRFATFFFAAPAPSPDASIRIDGGEIHDHAWLGPRRAMELRNTGEIELSPPTWITLEYLAAYDSTRTALEDLAAQPVRWFATRFAPVEGGAAALYLGDAGYDDENGERPGARHRLWMVGDTWRYERSDESGASSSS